MLKYTSASKLLLSLCALAAEIPLTGCHWPFDTGKRRRCLSEGDNPKSTPTHMQSDTGHTTVAQLRPDTAGHSLSVKVLCNGQLSLIVALDLVSSRKAMAGGECEQHTCKKRKKLKAF